MNSKEYHILQQNFVFLHSVCTFSLLSESVLCFYVSYLADEATISHLPPLTYFSWILWTSQFLSWCYSTELPCNTALYYWVDWLIGLQLCVSRSTAWLCAILCICESSWESLLNDAGFSSRPAPSWRWGGDILPWQGACIRGTVSRNTTCPRGHLHVVLPHWMENAFFHHNPWALIQVSKMLFTYPTFIAYQSRDLVADLGTPQPFSSYA